MSSTADRYHGPKKTKEREDAAAAEEAAQAATIEGLDADVAAALAAGTAAQGEVDALEAAVAAETAARVADVNAAEAAAILDTDRLRATASLNWGSIGGQTSALVNATVAGAATADNVTLHIVDAPTAGLVYDARVSAADTVTVRASNITSLPVDPAAQNFRITVWKA